MAGIFVSYRREDTAGHAGRLYDRLSAEFGERRIFMDIDTLRPGEDFVRRVEEAVGACDVLLAVIGHAWRGVESGGKQRLHDAQDFVRLEVAAALRRNVLVIPVLVQGARIPRADELPEDLASLSRRHAIELSDARWAYDVERLVRTIRSVVGEDSRPGQAAAQTADRDSGIKAANSTEVASIPSADELGKAVSDAAEGPIRPSAKRNVFTSTAQSRPAAPIAAWRVWARRRGRIALVAAIGVGAALIVLTGVFSSSRTAANPAGRVIGSPIRVGNAIGGIAVGAGAVWVTEPDDGTLVRIDPTSGRVFGRPIPVGSRPQAVAVGGGAVWVANASDESVVRVDPVSGHVGKRKLVRGDVSVIVGDTAVYATGLDSVSIIDTQIHPGGHRTFHTYDFYGHGLGDLCDAALLPPDEGLLASSCNGDVSFVNLYGGHVMRMRLRLEGGAAGIAVSGPLFEGPGVWVTNPGANTVTHITLVPLRTFSKDTKLILDRVRRRIRVGRRPVDVAIGADAVWVANARDKSVTRIDPHTNRVVGKAIQLAKDPVELAVNGETVWVGNGDGTVSRIDSTP